MWVPPLQRLMYIMQSLQLIWSTNTCLCILYYMLRKSCYLLRHQIHQFMFVQTATKSFSNWLHHHSNFLPIIFLWNNSKRVKERLCDFRWSWELDSVLICTMFDFKAMTEICRMVKQNLYFCNDLFWTNQALKMTIKGNTDTFLIMS